MSGIVLASASPSRLRLLRMVGIEPTVLVSGVDEESKEYELLSPKELVIALAIVKAHTVATMARSNPSKSFDLGATTPKIVIGCDSTFEFEGVSLGKPGTRERAIERCKAIQGKSGVLHTGHCIIDLNSMKEYSDIASTRVHFEAMSGSEIEAYVDSGEPLHVAGGFTLDGLSAPFIRSIEGDWSNVIGLSLPLVRRAITSFGYDWFDFVTEATPHQTGTP